MTNGNPSRGQFQDYLGMLGRMQLGDRLAGKVDVSGVVQTTLLDVSRQEDDWNGLPAGDRLRWLRRVFATRCSRD